VIAYIVTEDVEFLDSRINLYMSLILYPVIILIKFFCILKMFALFEEFPQNINP